MKKFVAAACVMFAAMASQAEYLYWQVQYSDANYFTYTVDGTTKVNAARVWQVGGDQTKTVGEALLELDAPPAMDTRGKIDLEDAAITGNYSYYIELIHYEAGKDAISLAVSETRTYTDLLSAGYIETQLTKLPMAWSGGTYVAPEPTSAMMILLGLAGLALRRKVIA